MSNDEMAPGPGKDTAMSETFQGSQDYVASEELMRAVNIAMVLQKPLLIKGEPGTGKTVLAEAIAKSLGKELIIWNIKSTTKAQDGLYVYDTVQRLYDSQFGGEGWMTSRSILSWASWGRPSPPTSRSSSSSTRSTRPIWSSPTTCCGSWTAWSSTSRRRAAPSPPSTARWSSSPPTRKKNCPTLPARCVFHYIEFPDKELMAQIVRVHFPDLDDKLLTQVLEAFYKIRQLPQIKKKPSTSEIIDWIQALIHGGYDPDRVVAEVPYLGVLLKKNEDIDALRKSWR